MGILRVSDWPTEVIHFYRPKVYRTGTMLWISMDELFSRLIDDVRIYNRVVSP